MVFCILLLVNSFLVALDVKSSYPSIPQNYGVAAIKVAVTNIKYFVRSNCSRGLVRRTNFGFIRLAVFKPGYVTLSREVEYFL